MVGSVAKNFEVSAIFSSVLQSILNGSPFFPCLGFQIKISLHMPNIQTLFCHVIRFAASAKHCTFLLSKFESLAFARFFHDNLEFSGLLHVRKAFKPSQI